MEVWIHCYPLRKMELDILRWLQTIHTDALDVFMKSVTSLGNGGIFWIILAVAFLAFRRTRLVGLSMAVALLMGFIVGDLTMKPLIARVRPYDAAGFTGLLIERQKDYSFPSGHTQAAFASAWVIWYYYRKAGIAALVLAAIIAFSRLYLFVHYPTDVLAGFLMGSFWAFLTIRLVMPLLKKKLTGTRAARLVEEWNDQEEHKA